MRLHTIWTLRDMSLRTRLELTKERATNTDEWFWRPLARRVPARLRYWVLIDIGARAILSDEVVPNVRFTEVLNRVPKR
jgi:hypothetical protein